MDKINTLLEIEMEDVREGEYRKKWEVIKLAIHGSTIHYATYKKKSNGNKLTVLENKLKRLEMELVNKSVYFEDTEEQIRLVKNEIFQINKEKTKGAIVRSKANWAFLGEKGTKYFLKLEKSNYTNKTLHRIKGEDGRLITGSNNILREIKSFYIDLYQSEGEIDEKYLGKLDIPKILVDLKKELEAPISQAEVSIALKGMASNKTPG